MPTSSKTVSEHTPLCSSCARYTNEKPPSPSTFIIWTINNIKKSISAKQLIYAYNQHLHVRPLILTAGVCWHKHEDNAQMASFAWSRKFSNTRKSCGGSAMPLTAFYRRGWILFRRAESADEWYRGKFVRFIQTALQHLYSTPKCTVLFRSTEYEYRDKGFTITSFILASWPTSKKGILGSGLQSWFMYSMNTNIPRLHSGVATRPRQTTYSQSIFVTNYKVYQWLRLARPSRFICTLTACCSYHFCSRPFINVPHDLDGAVRVTVLR